jgi:altronate dehydratase
MMPFSVVREGFVPSPEVPLTDAALTFPGFLRPGGRGVGTRNFVVIIGTTSASAGYVRALEVAAKGTRVTATWPSVDGVVAVAHTEGAGNRAAGDLPHNHALLTETLSSYVLHPNVGAALLVDYASNEETVWGSDVIEALGEAGVASEATHACLSLTGDHGADIAAGLAQIHARESRQGPHSRVCAACLLFASPFERPATMTSTFACALPSPATVLAIAGAAARTPQPAAALSIAQQCGGSDAFSGVSGNPVAGER